MRLVEVAQAAGAEATLIDGESRLDDALHRRARDDRPHRRRVDAGGARAERRARALRARLSDARGDHGRPRARPLPAAEGGRARMTSIEVPYSIAAALPTLSVMDITNDVVASRSRARARPRRHRLRLGDEPALARPRAGARDGLLRGSRVACSSASSRPASASRERLVARAPRLRAPSRSRSARAASASASGSGSCSSRSTRSTATTGR